MRGLSKRIRARNLLAALIFVGGACASLTPLELLQVVVDSSEWGILREFPVEGGTEGNFYYRVASVAAFQRVFRTEVADILGGLLDSRASFHGMDRGGE
jgi:hypothetical protein